METEGVTESSSEVASSAQGRVGDALYVDLHMVLGAWRKERIEAQI